VLLKTRSKLVSTEFDTQAAPRAEDESDESTAVMRMIGKDVVELVANLSGCSQYQTVPDCSENICFHRKYAFPFVYKFNKAHTTSAEGWFYLMYVFFARFDCAAVSSRQTVFACSSSCK